MKYEKTYYGLYYSFILSVRMELYNSLEHFAERLQDFAKLEGTDCEVKPYVVTIKAHSQENAERQLTKLAEGLK
jgi:hypothetical protein